MSWAEKVKLGALCSVVTKGTTPTTLGMSFEDDGVPFLRVQNISNSTVSLDDILFISQSTHDALERSKIKPGDFLITIAGTIGRTAIVPDSFPESNCNQAVAILRFNEHQLSPRYLLHWLNTDDAISQISGKKVTATISNLSLGQIKELEIPLPPLAEQKRIAALLDKADAIRRKRQQAIQLADDFLRAVFLEMFGDPLTNPKGWEVAGFQHYCELNPKNQKLTDDLEVSFVPMQKVSELSPVVDVTDIRTYSEVKKGFTAFAEGDVLFAKITPCMENGKAGITRNLRNGFGYGSTEFHVLRPFKSHYAEFLYSLVHLEVFRKHAASSFSGAVGHKRVPKDFFEKFALYKIPEELVSKFSQIFTETYKCVSSSSSGLLELDDLFNSLSQKAFSGKL